MTQIRARYQIKTRRSIEHFHLGLNRQLASIHIIRQDGIITPCQHACQRLDVARPTPSNSLKSSRRACFLSCFFSPLLDFSKACQVNTMSEKYSCGTYLGDQRVFSFLWIPSVRVITHDQIHTRMSRTFASMVFSAMSWNTRTVFF